MFFCLGLELLAGPDYTLDPAFALAFLVAWLVVVHRDARLVVGLVHSHERVPAGGKE